MLSHFDPFNHPPYWRTTALSMQHNIKNTCISFGNKVIHWSVYLTRPALWPRDTASEYCCWACSLVFTTPSYTWPSINLKKTEEKSVYTQILEQPMMYLVDVSVFNSLCVDHFCFFCFLLLFVCLFLLTLTFWICWWRRFWEFGLEILFPLTRPYDWPRGLWWQWWHNDCSL